MLCLNYNKNCLFELVPPPESQYSGDEVAESKSGPGPHRAPLGSFEAPCPWKNVYQQDRVVSHAPRRMEPHPSGHAQRPRGVYAEKNEGRDQVKGLPNKILSVFLVLLHCFCSLFIVLSCLN